MRAVVSRYLPRLTMIVMACMFLPSGFATGQEQPNNPALTFHIKPSDIVLPSNVPLGQYRRIVQPFENWTLICDENLKNNQRVCNIGQVIVNAKGQLVFSWSLAATEDGKPFLILRTEADAKLAGAVQVNVPGRSQPITLDIEGCNETVCVAKSPVGPIFREHIEKQSEVSISYVTVDN